MLQPFRDSLYTGALEQSIEMALREYDICARHHRYNPAQKAHYFLSFLDDPALRASFSHASESRAFQVMATVTADKFNSDSCQLPVYARLSNLRTGINLSESKLMPLSETMIKAVAAIEMNASQYPSHFSSEPHEITHHRHAVIRQNWACTPSSSEAKAQYSFSGFVTELCESMQLEDKMISARDNGSNSVALSNFIQQYARNARYIRDSTRKNCDSDAST